MSNEDARPEEDVKAPVRKRRAPRPAEARDDQQDDDGEAVPPPPGLVALFLVPLALLFVWALLQ